MVNSLQNLLFLYNILDLENLDMEVLAVKTIALIEVSNDVF